MAILGSELTAYDDTLPWLAAELAFIERMLAASVPVLGICFGGQALARVLGARLYRLPVPEIGWAQVTSGHPGLAEGPWLSWHRDAFELPAGAAQIAANEVCVQGFSYGPHAALQFHPEATQPIAASWLRFAVPPPGEEITGPPAAAWGPRVPPTTTRCPGWPPSWRSWTGCWRPRCRCSASASAPRRWPGCWARGCTG